MTRVRDSQRKRLFEAQKNVHSDLLTPDEAREWVKRIPRTRFWTTRWRIMGYRPPRTIEIVYMRSPICSAYFNTADLDNIVVESAQTITQLEIVHALAHVMFPDFDIEPTLHDAAFALRFSVLTRRYLGEDAYKALRETFRALHIKTKTYSPEARAAARERYLEQHIRAAPAELAAMIAEFDTED